MNMQATYVGTATLILEIGPLRLLTDPVFDPAGSHGRVGVIPGTRYASLVGASIGPQEVGALDAVLLSHDHHQDNLDEAGRALLAKAGKVLTTHTGANRLGGNTVGLRPWEVAEITGRNTTRIRVTATPCRHGPPFSKPIVGHVIGFLLEWKGQQDGAVYLSGDTVWFRGIQQLAVIK
ncbi:MAG: MBL fold metallo-hydrolase [bacterium]